MKNEQQRKNKQKTLVFTLAMACSLLFIGVILNMAPVTHALASPTVSINPVTQSVVQGTDFCIEVHVNSNGESIRTAGFQLTYPTIFTVKSFTYENLLGTSVIQMGAPSVGDTSGLINYAASRIDGGADSENGNLATICFTAPGSPGGPYTLDLHDIILVNGAGTALTGIGVTDGTVTVTSGSVPLAAQCNGPYSGMATSPVSFMGSATGGTPSYTYAWDFNYDGTFNTQSTLQNPTYTYTMAGTYTVALRVTDSTTATDMCTTTATISPYTPTTPPYLQADPTGQTIMPSESFCVDIMVDSDPHTVKTVGFQLSYNGTWFTVQSFTYENLLGASVLEMGTPSMGDDSGLINYAVSRTDGGADMENGKIVTICFTSKPGTPEGTYPLDIHDAILIDGSSAAISGITIVDGEVTINACANTPDVNNDGKVNVLDMILVGQHWGQTGDPGWTAEDINCDGIINILDMISIGQNWTG